MLVFFCILLYFLSANKCWQTSNVLLYCCFAVCGNYCEYGVLRIFYFVKLIGFGLETWTVYK